MKSNDSWDYWKYRIAEWIGGAIAVGIMWGMATFSVWLDMR